MKDSTNWPFNSGKIKFCFSLVYSLHLPYIVSRVFSFPILQGYFSLPPSPLSSIPFFLPSLFSFPPSFFPSSLAFWLPYSSPSSLLPSIFIYFFPLLTLTWHPLYTVSALPKDVWHGDEAMGPGVRCVWCISLLLHFWAVIYSLLIFTSW